MRIFHIWRQSISSQQNFPSPKFSFHFSKNSVNRAFTDRQLNFQKGGKRKRKTQGRGQGSNGSLIHRYREEEWSETRFPLSPFVSPKTRTRLSFKSKGLVDVAAKKKKKEKKRQDVALIPPRLDPIPFSNDLRIKLAEFARFNHHHHPGKRPPLAKFHLIGRACGN